MSPHKRCHGCFPAREVGGSLLEPQIRIVLVAVRVHAPALCRYPVLKVEIWFQAFVNAGQPLLDLLMFSGYRGKRLCALFIFAGRAE